MKFKLFNKEFDFNLFDLTKSILLIVVAVFAINYLNKLEDKLSKGDSQRNPLTDTEIIRITDNLIKARVGANNTTLEDEIAKLKSSNSIIYSEAKKNNESINEIGKILTTMKGNTGESHGDYTPDPVTPSKSFYDTLIFGKDSNNADIPLGRVFFSPNLKPEEDPWTYQVFPLKYGMNVVSTKSEDGVENRYVEAWVENDTVPSSKGKKFPIKIDKVEWVQRETVDEKFRLNPRLSLTAIMGTSGASPAIGLSIFSYGKTKRDMTWKFVDFSAGAQEGNLALALTPFSYNVGTFIPLVENVFVGPSVGYGIEDKKYTLGAGVSIPF